jgi:hypothetical protein
MAADHRYGRAVARYQACSLAPTTNRIPNALRRHLSGVGGGHSAVLAGLRAAVAGAILIGKCHEGRIACQAFAPNQRRLLVGLLHTSAAPEKPGGGAGKDVTFASRSRAMSVGFRYVFFIVPIP